MAGPVEQGLAEVRGKVERACELLITPSPKVLDRCSSVLEEAAAELARRLASLEGARGDRAAQKEARRLWFSVRCARRLLENASEYRFRLDGLLRAATAGYTARGDPAPLQRAGRVSVQG